MHVDITPVNDVVLVRPEGRLTIGSGDIQLRNTLVKLAAEGHKKVVLALDGIISADSSGLGELVSAFTSLTSHDGHLVLADLSPKIHDLLTVTGLISIFEVYDNADDAIRSFEHRRRDA